MVYIRVDGEELINTFRVPKVGRRLRSGYLRKNVVASLFLIKRTSLPGLLRILTDPPTHFFPTMMKKVKNPPNHHHVIVTKSCLKRQGEIANEMSHSWSFSHWCGGGGAGAGGDDEEEETRTTSSCDLLFLASPEDWALMKPRLTKKTVSFSDKESRKCTLSISEYTQDEILKSWYSRHELSNILDEYDRSWGPSPSPNETATELLDASASSSYAPLEPGVDEHKYLTTQADAERMGLLTPRSRTTTTMFQQQQHKVDTNEDEADGEEDGRNNESSREECNNGRRGKFLFVDRLMKRTVRQQQ